MMNTIRLADALDKYDPLIVNTCQRLWNTTCNSGAYVPCELADLIQAARVRIVEKWAHVNHRGSVAPYMRAMARAGAVDLLRSTKRHLEPPLDLTQFAGIAAAP